MGYGQAHHTDNHFNGILGYGLKYGDILRLDDAGFRRGTQGPLDYTAHKASPHPTCEAHLPSVFRQWSSTLDSYVRIFANRCLVPWSA